MRVSVLGSGSRGNAFLIDAGSTRVLVDVGFGVRTIASRLAQLGCAPESISAVVLTHEHVDHAQGALAACARWQWPLYATEGTLAALPQALVPVRTITHGKPWSMGDVVGVSAPVPHDAADCAALVFEHARTGQRAGIALDLGHVPEHLPVFLSKLDVLVVESNHDHKQLLAGPYPWSLKQRILGSNGHLSNDDAAELVACCVHRGLRGVVLAHLSETNNSATLAVSSMAAMLRRCGPKASTARGTIVAAAQRSPIGPIAGPSERVFGVGQLELSL